MIIQIPMTCCKGWESPWTSNGSYVPPAVDVNACLGESAIPGLPVAAFFNTKVMCVKDTVVLNPLIKLRWDPLNYHLPCYSIFSI